MCKADKCFKFCDAIGLPNEHQEVEKALSKTYNNQTLRHWKVNPKILYGLARNLNRGTNIV